LSVENELAPIRNLHDMPEESPTNLLDRLKRTAFLNHLLVLPERAGYYPGERISVEVFSIDGCSLGLEHFRVGGNAGSGFAGQVYWALPDGRVHFYSEVGGKTSPVAIKVLKPKSHWKRIFRDLLFQLSFQTSYAPRLREEALRTGLIWQALLRVAARLEFGAESAIAKPLGYYWDDALGSFAEVHEWVEGKTALYEADDEILLRMINREFGPPTSVMGRKKQFMGALARLCREIGATGLARQYEWYTFVSQANVLTRREKLEGNEFTAVDCRPGLAVPFFLPLSPVHARIILAGLARGDLVHFDEVDFKKLDGYVNAHAAAFESFDGFIQRLKEDDRRYRAGLPGLWHAGKRNYFLKSRWMEVKSAAVEDRRKLGHVSDAWAGRLMAAGASFAPFLLFDRIPLFGPLLLRLLYDEKYRQHVRLTFSDAAYFKERFTARRAADLLSWYVGGRISAERCERLSSSTSVYLYDKLVLSWLPASAHRLLTDGGMRARLVQAWFVRPFSLMVNRREREKWFIEILREQVEKGVLGEDQISRLELQIREPRLQGFLRDLGFMLGLEVLAKFLYLALAGYGLTSRNFLPLGLAVLSPIPPSGVARVGYVIAQLLADIPQILRDWDKKLLLTRGVGLAAAPWRGFGNLFALLEMFTYYSELSLLLGNKIISRMVAFVPVLGGTGKLLEYWAFQAAYNLPLSVKRAVLEIPSSRRPPVGEEIVEQAQHLHPRKNR
jgi:hypothetical protein